MTKKNKLNEIGILKITKIYEIWRKTKGNREEHKGECVKIFYDSGKQEYKFTFRDKNNKNWVKSKNIKDTEFNKIYKRFYDGLNLFTGHEEEANLYRGIIHDIMKENRVIADNKLGLRLRLVEMKKSWGYCL